MESMANFPLRDSATTVMGFIPLFKGTLNDHASIVPMLAAPELHVTLFRPGPSISAARPDIRTKGSDVNAAAVVEGCWILIIGPVSSRTRYA